MSILRSFESSLARVLGALTASHSASAQSQVFMHRKTPGLLVPFFLVLGLLLASVGSVSAASYALDQKLTSADFTTDVPANVPGLEFGQALAVAGNWLVVGAPQDNDGLGAVYLYERVSGTWAYRTQIVQPNLQAGAQFGTAVDIYEAGGLVTVIIGAPLFDAAQTNQGRVFIFSDVDTGAGLAFALVTINPDSPETDGHFGASVALFANAAAIGSPNHGVSDEGLVSIRGRNVGGSNSWGQIGLTKTGPIGSSFGTSVDLHGEYLIVGAPLAENVAALRGGAAYVYRQDLGGANAWGIKHTLFPSAGQAGHMFGQSVGIWDSNLGAADSTSRSMIGAPLYDDGGTVDVGRVTFFTDATNSGQFTGESANQQYGYSVALEASDAVAGGPTETVSSQPNTGQVNTFNFNGTAWATNTINLTQTGAQARYLYGYSVDLSGTVAVIGAPGSREDALNVPPGAVRAGIVETLEKPGVTWAKDTDSYVIARFDLPNTAEAQDFAYDVDMTSDWLVIGVRGDAQRGATTGAAYVYRNVSGVWTPHSRLTGLYGDAGDSFGTSVAIYGTRIVVGAPGADGFPATVSNAGAFYVFVFNGTHWVQSAHVHSPNPVANGQFGVDIDYQGDVLVVGAAGENGNRGRAYAYRDFSTYSSPIALNIAAASVNSATGFSVSVFDPAPSTANDEVIAVGAYNENSTQGAAYVLSGASFSTVTTLVDPAPGASRFFGYAVSIHSGRVAVGAPTATAAPSGRVVVFSGSGYTTATTLPAASGSAGQFGLSLNLEGTSLVVGSPATAGRAGLAHVYGFSAGTWTEQGPLQPSDLAAFDEYGTAVTQSNGLFAVGAPLHNANSISNSGAAYVFSSAPEVTVDPTTLSVAEAGTTSDTFVVSLNQAPATNVTIQLTFNTQVQVDSGSGFGASPQTVTLTPANATTGVTVTVRAVDDFTDEASPHSTTITTAVTSSATARFNGLTVDDVTVDITDNDTAGVSITQSSGGNAVSESGLTDTYSIVLGSQPSATVNVSISFPAGELTVNGDTDGTYNTTFNSGNWNEAQTITLAAINDRALEGNHGGTLTHAFVSSDANYNAVTALVDGSVNSNALSVAITDNESAVLAWSPVSGSAAEGASVATAVQLDITADPVGGTPTLEGTLSYTSTFTAGSASAADVGVALGSLSFTNVSDLASNALSIPHLDDALVEGSESYSFVLALDSVPAGMNVSVSPTVFSGTIVDGDTATLALSGVPVVAESLGSTPLTVTLSTSGATLANGLSVVLNLIDGTASYAGGSGDFALAGPSNNVVVNIPAGSGNGFAQAVPVTINNDAMVEGDESFSAALGAVTGAATVSGGPLSVTITDNDSATVSFQPPSSSAPEAITPHTVNAVLSITADGVGTPQLQSAATVAVTETSGTATAADYTLSTTSLSFPAGSVAGLVRVINVNIVSDAISEGNESFSLGFGAVSGMVTASGSHTVTIADDDAPGITVTESDGNTAVTEGGSSDSYSVVLTSQPTADVTVNLTFDPAQLIVNGETDGTAGLTFTAANWDDVQNVNVVAVDDTLIEANPHSSAIVQTASSADGVYAAINPADVTVSITENDSQQIGFVLANSAVGEAAGTHVVQARLSLLSNGTPGGTISAEMSATVAATLGTAEASDFTLGTTTITFPAGAAHNSILPIDVLINNDRLLEGGESLSLGLQLVTATGSVSGTHTVTINDDETAVLAFVAPSSFASEFSGTSSTPVALTISGSGSGPATLVEEASVVISHAPGTASSPADYSVSTSVLSFAAGSLSGATLDVNSNIVDDRWVEGDETYTLSLGAVTATGAVSSSGTHVQTIADNDSASFSFAPGDDTVGEAVGSFSKTVSLSISANGTGTAGLQNSYAVPVSAVAGGATTPADFSLTTSSLSFVAGALDGSSQSVSVSIVDDLISEGDESFQLRLLNDGAPPFISLGRATTTVTITDNDAPGITVTESAGNTTVAEGGDTDSYSVVLTSQPTADVTVNLTFDPAQLIVNGETDGTAGLTFTAANWDDVQNVNVVAVDDTLIEANPHSSAIVQTASSADAVYAAINPADVTVSITENDSQQISFVQVSSTVGEAAGAHVVQARLSLLSNGTPGGTISAEMSATVAATLGTAEASDFTLGTTTITFPAGAAHNSTLPIDLSISNDRALEGDENFTLGLQLVGTLGSVNGTHEVTITDNESGAIGFIGPASSVAEGLGPLGVDTQLIVSGTGSGPFVVESAAAVVIVQTPGTAASPVDYSVATSLITFPAGSISGATQSISSSIVDDRWVEGDETYALSFGAVSASGVVTASGTHAVTISDNDTASFGFAPGDDTVSEALGVFNKAVSLSISAIGTGTAGLQNGYALPVGFVEGTATEPEDFQLSSSTLNFAAGALDGASLQASAIIVDDVIAEIDESFQLNLSSAGAPSYITLGRSSTSVTIDDNDTPGVTINPGDGVTVTEGGATDSYTLVLNSQPTADVTLTLSGTQVTTSPTSVVFTALNWNVAQTVTVTAIDDAVAEGTHSGSVSTSSASADGNYQGIAVTQVSVEISDNDSAAITLTQSDGSTDVTEGGATDTYTAVLTSQPTADVTLSFSGTQVTTSPSSVVFTVLNWNVAQSVTVTAIDDAVAEGNHSGSISTVVSGDDTTYSALSVANIAVNISDNDNAGVTLVQSNGSTEVTEGGVTDSYTVQLSSQPTAEVTLNLSGTQVTTSPTTLNFSAANWDQPQTVTVTAIDDVIVEGPHSGSVSTTVVSSDGNYNGLSVTAVSVAITDNDVAGLSISDASIVEGNSGTSALVFTVTLNVAVPEAFTVGYSSTDGTAAAGSDYLTAGGTLSFAGTASETQTLNVTINGDAVLEAVESFTVNLGTPSSALVAVNDGQGSGSIENDDSASLSATPVIQAEGDSGTSNFSFALQLSGQVQDGFTVRAVTRDDTALAGSDYNAADVNVSFDGSLNPTRTVLIGVIGDVLPEARERFWLDLSSTQPGLVINPASLSGEIENDDLFADLSVSNTQLPGPLGKGSVVEFEVVVRNLSEVVDAPAAQFSMALSETLDPLDWTCTAAVGATCPASGSGLPNHSIALDAGSSVTYRVRATVNTTTQPDDQVGSTATITISAPYSDPDSSNNSASAGGNVGTDRVFQNGFESVQ